MLPKLPEIKSKEILSFTFLYLFVSIAFSFFIFLRLRVLPLEIIKYADTVLYFANYHVIAILALSWLLSSFLSLKGKTRLEQALGSFLVLIVTLGGYLLLVFASLSEILPEYIVMLIPVILVSSFPLARYKPENGLSKRKMLAVACLMLSVSVLLPHLSAFLSYNSILTRASSESDDSGRAMFVSDVVRTTTTFQFPYFDFFRGGKDFWKFLLTGVGACGESARATATFLNGLGLEARIAGFPGEDHSFVEVKIGGKWMVLDPGYYSSELLTREQRAARRLEEFGAISYAIAYLNSSFVELTPYYVPTDTIVIRITYAGEPVVDAAIFLSHRFMGRTLRLPDSTLSFYTDGNGTITLHLGALTYKDSAKQYDACYWIYINNQSTGRNVTSTGTGLIRTVEIDLSH